MNIYSTTKSFTPPRAQLPNEKLYKHGDLLETIVKAV